MITDKESWDFGETQPVSNGEHGLEMMTVSDI